MYEVSMSVCTGGEQVRARKENASDDGAGMDCGSEEGVGGAEESKGGDERDNCHRTTVKYVFFKPCEVLSFFAIILFPSVLLRVYYLVGFWGVCMSVCFVPEVRDNEVVGGTYDCGVTEVFPKTIMAENSALLSGVTKRHSEKSQSSRGPYVLALPDSYSKSTSVSQIANPL